MRKYHCGGTDRSIDTLQVESEQDKIQKKQKHIFFKKKMALSMAEQSPFWAEP